MKFFGVEGFFLWLRIFYFGVILRSNALEEISLRIIGHFGNSWPLGHMKQNRWLLYFLVLK